MYELFDENYCQYKLPCGLCMRTNSPCGYSKTVVTVTTWTATINDTNSSVVNIPNCELKGANDTTNGD